MLSPKATPQEKELYKRTLELRVALSSPLDYACHVTASTVRYRHHEVMNDYLMALLDWRLYKSGIGPPAVRIGTRGFHPVTGERAIRKIQIAAPTQIGKSFLLAEHFPAWFLTKYPDLPLVFVAYNDDFARRWSKKSRRLVEEHPEFGIKVSPDQGAALAWEIEGHRGGEVASGIGGSITGNRAFGLIVDDLVKNAEEAQSETTLKKHGDEYDATLSSRVAEDGFEVIICTRWSKNDLQGRLRKQSPDEWFILNFPALSFDDVGPDGVSIDIETGQRDPLGRTPGQSVCPEKYSAEYYLDRKKRSPMWFNAISQGRPMVEGGNLLKDIYTHTLENDVYKIVRPSGSEYHVDISSCTRFATIDLAATVKSYSDFSVFCVFDYSPAGHLFLHDMVKVKIESYSHLQWVETLQKQYNCTYIGVESVTYGLTLLQAGIYSGLPFIPLKADKDKVSRFQAAIPKFTQGTLTLPELAVWRPDLENTLRDFPDVTHDDDVDTIGYGVKMLEYIPKPLENKPPESQYNILSPMKSRGTIVHHPTLGSI